MNRKYFGDSYDAVKRLWSDLLVERAPLYAEGQFIPNGLRDDYTRLTGIPILSEKPTKPYSILNDPDTGIRLPGEKNQSESRIHISIQKICEQHGCPGLLCVVTYDQSNYRNIKLNLEEQQLRKMRALDDDHSIYSFYYVSHAPFLFTFSTKKAMQEVKRMIKKVGIPDKRILE